ncbi:ATP/GTP-binding protein [Streptomyces roseoverticillatus]|nr:ATP/GTP-binding protein [Streptomyces roseoverticillatus]
MMEQNGKLHAAMIKAKGDKAAARGKAGADRMKSPGSGLGADKGRSKAGGGGGSSRGGGGSSPSRSTAPGANRPGSPSRGGTKSGGSSGRSGAGPTGSGGGKGGMKGADRPSGSRTSGSGRNGASGGSKGSQAGPGGSSRNSGGSKGGSRPSHHGPAGGPRAERSRGRQERAGARQAARQERRSAGHAAGLEDRRKDRDQARANRQKDWEDRRAKKAERQAARKAKREAAASAGQGRTTLGAAVAEEAQRRWDKRRADADATAEKANQSKDKKKVKKAADGASGAGKGGAASDEQSKASKDRGGASGGSDKAKRDRRSRRWRARRTGRKTRRGRARRTGRRGWRWSWDSLFDGDDSAITVEWLKHPGRPPRTADGGEDGIEDAVIVEDDPASAATCVQGLPPAPEPHTQRPGTTRDTGTEGSNVNSTEVAIPSGQGGLAAQHRTDITFDEYLVEMANIAIQAASHQERLEALKDALARVADALRDMAADLVDDHNIDMRVTGQITDVADAAGEMKIQAERCAEQCDMANEAARLGAALVARVYGQDMDAKEDADLKHTSAAAHHD